MLGPFATASRRTPIHQVSLLSHARIDVHDNDDNDNATRDRGDRYGPIEWAKLLFIIQARRLALRTTRWAGMRRRVVRIPLRQLRLVRYKAWTLYGQPGCRMQSRKTSREWVF